MITVKDVAREAGVSLASVSRVINGAENVSANIKSSVQQAIDRLGYFPNHAARSLVRKQTGSIAVLMRNLHSPFYGELIRGLEDGIGKANRTVFFCSLGHDQIIRDQYMQFLTNGVSDALILYGSLFSDQPIIERLQAARFPFLLIENNFQNMDVHQFLVDNVEGAYKAVSYLIERGHRKICHFMGDPNKKVNLDRLNGYSQAMQQNGLHIEGNYIRNTLGDAQNAYAMAQDIMLGPAKDRPTAFFCCSDRIAASAIRGIFDCGYRVPNDISVVGYDDLRMPDDNYDGPRITSVHQPLYEMGAESIQAVVSMLTAPPAERISRVFCTSLAEHETVRSLA